MTARRITAVLVLACAVYLLLIAQRAVILLTSGSWIPAVMGAALLVLPVIGSWVIWREITFGRATSEMATELAERGELPVDDLARRPSGRPYREAADRQFEERRRQVERAPQDWGTWFRLGLAYDDAGDRRRARQAMRHAIALHTKSALR